MRLAILAGCLLSLMGVRRPDAAVGQEADTLLVQPARMEIGVFYHGARLVVSTVIDTGTDVAVLVSGAAEELHLRRQSRVWGMFWAPGGEIAFDSVPTMYLLSTSMSAELLAPPQQLAELGIGYESFRPKGDTTDGRKRLFPDLVRLKESEGLFHYSIGEVRHEPIGAGRETVTVTFKVASKARAGVYRVQLFGFHHQALTVRREATFSLGRGAFNAFVGSLVRGHALVYGLLAVVVAGGAGLLVGLVFGSVKGH
jgi:hypothetical protein